jgi:hypothetical protein
MLTVKVKTNGSVTYVTSQLIVPRFDSRLGSNATRCRYDINSYRKYRYFQLSVRDPAFVLTGELSVPSRREITAQRTIEFGTGRKSKCETRIASQNAAYGDNMAMMPSRNLTSAELRGHCFERLRHNSVSIIINPKSDVLHEF